MCIRVSAWSGVEDMEDMCTCSCIVSAFSCFVGAFYCICPGRFVFLYIVSCFPAAVFDYTPHPHLPYTLSISTPPFISPPPPLFPRNPKEPSNKSPVIVAGKDVGEVDNDYFLVPVKILDHDGPLGTTFPIENRLLPQGVGRDGVEVQCFV